MAHYAKVILTDKPGILEVENVIVADQEFVDSQPGTWIQTSYNTRGNVHYGEDGKPDGKPALRGNYAGIGHIYDSTNDVFYSKSPFPSWSLDKKTWTWEAPVAYPNDGKPYRWDESAKKWVLIELPAKI